MICPLAPRIWNSPVSFTESDKRIIKDCTVNCAWWDDKKKQCDYKSKRQALESIAESLKTIAQRDSISIKGVVSTHES